jgi:hypothetical protein
VAALALAAGTSLGGCAEIPATSTTTYQPASLESTTPDGPKKVTFTGEAVERVDLQTSRVEQRGDQVVVDYAALVYDKTGKSWVFTVVAPLTFLRAPVRVDRIEGNQVLLDRGPSVGTQLVTRGAIEVWGAELGISGKH